MSKLINISTDYRKRADELLGVTTLIPFLKRFGEVVFDGSYAANLMMYADIDMKVILDEPFTSDEVLRIFNELYKINEFHSYILKGDWNDPRIGDEFPNGLYVGVKKKINDEAWKIDIWFVERTEYERLRKSYLSISNTKLSDKQKLFILKMKQLKKEGKIKFLSQTLYEAVINGDCLTTHSFKKYLKKNKS